MKRPEKIKKQISDTLANICRGSEALLIGLTGGIATGKSTVADILKDLGAAIIDFDLLARSVVEPGKQSWQLITEFFGNNILNPDNTINRKKLSDIVFNDPLKREKLELYTHPFIWDEFIRQVKSSITLDEKAIILAVAPLLIEGKMQGLFMKNIVVYSSPDIQVNRLMTRDGITQKMANKILGSQMPIDDKVKYGDFIINNEGSIEDVVKEVTDLWKILKQIQENRKP
jgi:dephospho-CoA kinase